MGNTEETDLLKAKDEIKDILKQNASKRAMIPYSDLVANLQSMRLEAHDTRLFRLLGDISVEENEEGRGMLSVIVVHKHGDVQPGPGFFELAKQLGRDTSDILQCWVDELKKVHYYWSTLEK
ncbi:MAG: hypothetical protein ABUK01_06310 [Leptospirales bacterium]